jgi:nucleoside phosphorylase
MRRIVAIASEEREFHGLLRMAERNEPVLSKLRFARRIVLNGNDSEPCEWLLLADGMGMRAATRACAEIQQPESLTAIVSIGYCGATNDRWKTGDVLAATEVRRASTAERYPCVVPTLRDDAQPPQGVLLTVDRIVRFAADKHRIGEDGVDAVEMEAAAVARFANENGVPFAALKAVSDTVHEDMPVNFSKAQRPDGTLRMTSVLAQAVARPLTSLPALRRLEKAARLCSQRLGEVMMGLKW